MTSQRLKPSQLTVFDGFEDEFRPTGPQEHILALFLSKRRKDEDSDETYVMESEIMSLLSPQQKERRNRKTGNTNDKRISLDAHCRRVRERLGPQAVKTILRNQLQFAREQLYTQPGPDPEVIYEEFLKTKSKESPCDANKEQETEVPHADPEATTEVESNADENEEDAN